jgi:hypothetical protein
MKKLRISHLIRPWRLAALPGRRFSAGNTIVENSKPLTEKARKQPPVTTSRQQ